ncbi:MAG: RNA polymerase sigma factor [Acidimicrobiia bacterium]|nr:MAG: RNA polymerase sigma factor [Acidimicrobiia bacterium]
MELHGLDEVVGAAQIGEEWAWSRLYEIVAPRLMGYFRVRGVPNPEDLVGETFVQLARNLSTFEGDASSFQSWVFMIAHHRLSNHRRRFARKPETLTSTPIDDGRRSPSAESVALDAIGSSTSMAMLSVLTAEQRSVVALRFVADLSVNETAEIMGSSAGAVKQLTRRALLRLRKEISQEVVTQ